MINYSDYNAYIMQNNDFIGMLKDNKTILYERVFEIKTILDYLSEIAAKGNKLQEEMHVIFEVGFSYLHEQLEEIKLYYDIYFKKNVNQLKKYDKFINYSLYLSDLKDTLIDKAIYGQKTKTTFEKIANKIDKILKGLKKADDEIFDEFNIMLEECVPVGTLTTLEVFALVSEELNI